MFRGDPPDDLHFAFKDIEYHLFYSKYGQFSISELQLLPKVKGTEPNKKVSFLIRLKRAYREIFEKKISAGENINIINTPGLDHGHDYFENDPASLDIHLEIIYKEDTGTKISNFFKTGSGHNSKLDKYFSPKLFIPQKEAENQKFDISLFDGKNNEYTLSLRFKITGLVEHSVILTLIKEPFVAVHMNDVLNEYLMFDLKNKDFREQKGEGIRAQHKTLVNFNNGHAQLFTVDILHIVSLQWSSIKIMLGKNVLATSHLIGLIQLPLSQQVNNDPTVFTLDPKFEKAMLIRNLNGDYAIVKGKWVGFKRGVPPAKNRRGVRGDPGRLAVAYYSFASKKKISVDITKDLTFEIKNEFISSKVDFNTGKIIINFLTKSESLEAESNLALVFSIIVLHVLLQPKPKPYLDEKLKKFTLPSTSSNARFASGVRPSTRPADLDTVILLSCIGYPELIASNCFYHHYHCIPHHHHDHHHHHHDHFDNNNNHGISHGEVDINDYNNQIDLNVDGAVDGNNTDWLFGGIEGGNETGGFEIGTDSGNNGDSGIGGGDTYFGGCGGCGSGGGGGDYGGGSCGGKLNLSI